jgi:fructose-specific phosphotransferase system IIC component
MNESNVLDPEQASSVASESDRMSAKSVALIILAVILILGLIAGVVLAIIAMVNHPESTENIRDIVIVFMAAEFLFIGLVLILLVIQMARLTALIRHEVRPILESTNQTMGTIRGTTTFLSDNLVSPVIKANSALAAVRRAAEMLAFWRRP